MMFSYGTSSPVSVETRFWRIRVLVVASSWWKRTSFWETALNSLMGTLTSPKLMAPLQIERGIPPLFRRFFPHHLAGVLVLPQAFERGLAQRAVARPLVELDLGNQFGLDAHRVLQPGQVAERTRLPPPGVEQGAVVAAH